jgi:hypothetical protein
VMRITSPVSRPEANASSLTSLQLKVRSDVSRKHPTLSSFKGQKNSKGKSQDSAPTTECDYGSRLFRVPIKLSRNGVNVALARGRRCTLGPAEPVSGKESHAGFCRWEKQRGQAPHFQRRR